MSRVTRAFFESPDATRIRAEAGVDSPTFLYLAVADEGTLPPTERTRDL